MWWWRPRRRLTLDLSRLNWSRGSPGVLPTGSSPTFARVVASDLFFFFLSDRSCLSWRVLVRVRLHCRLLPRLSRVCSVNEDRVARCDLARDIGSIEQSRLFARVAVRCTGMNVACNGPATYPATMSRIRFRVVVKWLSVGVSEHFMKHIEQKSSYFALLELQWSSVLHD